MTTSDQVLDTVDGLLHTLTKVCNTLNDNGIPFAVGGGCAVYARGGPPTGHDVDLFVKPEDAERATSTLVAAGMRAAPPPEDWLRKVYDGDRLVDIVYRPNYRAVTDRLLDRASWMRVGPTSALVISGTDLMIDKLMVLDEHRLDFTTLLRIARDLREQIDWHEVQRATAASPYARAFLGLIEDLAIAAPAEKAEPVEAENVLPEYLAAHLRRTLAEDPRTTELGVRVSIHGNEIRLDGDVSSAQRRHDLVDVVGEQLPSVRIDNHVRVVDSGEPDHEEDLR